MKNIIKVFLALLGLSTTVDKAGKRWGYLETFVATYLAVYGLSKTELKLSDVSAILGRSNDAIRRKVMRIKMLKGKSAKTDKERFVKGMLTLYSPETYEPTFRENMFVALKLLKKGVKKRKEKAIFKKISTNKGGRKAFLNPINL